MKATARQQVCELLKAFSKNKREPNAENLEAFFLTLEQSDVDTVLLPILELTYKVIDQYALNMGQRSEEVIQELAPAYN